MPVMALNFHQVCRHCTQCYALCSECKHVLWCLLIIRFYICPTEKFLDCKAWLSKFADRYGDNMPDVEEIHLPSCLTKMAVFHMYLEEAKNTRADHHEQSSFYTLWQNECSHIKIPKVNTTCMYMPIYIDLVLWYCDLIGWFVTILITFINLF